MSLSPYTARALLGLILIGILVVFCQPADGQTTPNLACTHAASNASSYVFSNQCDDAIDNATNSSVTIEAFATDADATLPAGDVNTGDPGLRSGAHIILTSAVGLTQQRQLTLPALERAVVFTNSTTGGLPIVLTQGGLSVEVANGATVLVVMDGTDVIQVAGGGNGGGPTAISLVPQNMIQIGHVSASNQASVIFDFDASRYSHVWLTIGNLVGSIDERSIYYRVRQAGVTKNAASTYRWDLTYQNSASSGGTLDSNVDDKIAISRTDTTGRPGNDVGETWTGWVQLVDPNNSGGETRMQYMGNFGQSNVASMTTVIGQSAYYGDLNPVDGFEIFMEEGNISSGQFYLWGAPKEALTFVETAQTTDATVTVLWSLPLAAGEGAMVEAQVTASISTGGQTYSANILNTGQNAAGTTTVGTQVRNEIELGTPNASLNASLVANDTTDEIELQVTGAAGETWNWIVAIKATKI